MIYTNPYSEGAAKMLQDAYYGTSRTTYTVPSTLEEQVHTNLKLALAHLERAQMLAAQMLEEEKP